MNNISKDQEAYFITDFLIYIFGSFGISLLIASAFSYTIETASFINYIKRILTDVVISKDFLKNLDISNKKETLRLILNPPEYKENLYKNIDGYIQEYIDNSINLFQTNFKSNLTLNLFVTYQENNKLIIEGKISYKIHRILQNFEPIKCGFDHSDSELLEIKITTPDREVIKVNRNDFKKNEKKKIGVQDTEYRYYIPDNLQKYDYLITESKFLEKGHSNWQVFRYKNLSPLDGLNINLHCDSGLSVKDHMIFDEDENYSISVSNKKHIQIFCHQWVKIGAGVSILIGNKNLDHDQKRCLYLPHNDKV